MAKLTPMMEQYLEMKKKYPNTIVFFRLGDFYEMFYEDAVTVSKELDLTLTSRDRNKPEEERTPMCGIPYHASEGYLGRLIAKGYKVAICEQKEEASAAKGLVHREVVRVVSPGTVTESSMLDAQQNNFLAVIYAHTADKMVETPGDIVLCLADISTGSILMKNIPLSNTVVSDLCNELLRYAPRETVLSQGAMSMVWIRDFICERLETPYFEGNGFLPERGKAVYQSQFPHLPMAKKSENLACIGGLFDFLEESLKTDLSYISSITSLNEETFMEINQETRRNLELVETLWAREKRGSLLWVLDKTKTSMGGRMLREWLQRPLLDLSEIYSRQCAVGELKENALALGELSDSLREIPDLERTTARISYGTAGSRELQVLGHGLGVIARLKSQLAGYKQEKILALLEEMEELPELVALLSAALLDELPISVREGGMIRQGFHQGVDDLNHVVSHGGELITELEVKTKESTNIRNLKVRYNRVFGYYIEVSKAQAGAVPSHWVRKQTTTNSERFISEELKELEHTILTAKEKVTALEYEIFKKLREEVCKFVKIIQVTAVAVAEMDVLASLALVANQENYVAPQVEISRDLQIVNGRHPVVEKMLTQGNFVENDTEFLEKEQRCAIITGANMAGKSTYMRQVALIVLMAQIGSYVPATSAKIGLVDQIFTRIGASDDLAAGRSTFMVEMSEVATLLQRATDRSLLVLDEIGRGTSTYDGMATARAVLEYCCEQIQAKTLFATHYHELTAMAESFSGVKNYHLAAKQKGDNILFLRKILEGSADQSYGIQVAKLAGVPDVVIQRAYAILEELESGGLDLPRPVAKPQVLPETEEEKQEKQVISQLKACDLDDITPRQGIELLQKWKDSLGG